jgi:hypothetical protein
MMNPKDASGLAGDSLLTHINSNGDSHGEVSQYTDTTFVFGMSFHQM